MYEFHSSLPDKDTLWTDISSIAKPTNQFTKTHVTFIIWFYLQHMDFTDAKKFLTKYINNKTDRRLHIKHALTLLVARIADLGLPVTIQSISADITSVTDDSIEQSNIEPYEVFILMLDATLTFAKTNSGSLIRDSAIASYEEQYQDYYKTGVITKSNINSIDLNTEFKNIFQFNDELGVDIRVTSFDELKSKLTHLIVDKLVDTGIYSLNGSGPIFINEIYCTVQSMLRPKGTRSISHYETVEKTLFNTYLPIYMMNEIMEKSVTVQIFDRHKTKISHDRIDRSREYLFQNHPHMNELTWRPDISFMVFRDQTNLMPDNLDGEDVILAIHINGSYTTGEAYHTEWNSVVAFFVLKCHDYTPF